MKTESTKSENRFEKLHDRAEDVHRMHAQILNLRAAMITFSVALCRFPACGTPMGCNLRSQKTTNLMRQIHQDMHDLALSARMVLTAAFIPQPEVWDTIWHVVEKESSPERALALFGHQLISDQAEYIGFYGQLDDQMSDLLGTAFSQDEWVVLGCEDAWQYGYRLSQILHFTKYLEKQMEKKFDLFLAMGRNCEVKEKAELRRSATA